jgi:hypothetical protein
VAAQQLVEGTLVARLGRVGQLPIPGAVVDGAKRT